MKRLWLIHLGANAVLLWLLWEWLGIRDARAWQLILTAVTGLLLASAAIFLHAGTFHWIATKEFRPHRRGIVKFSAVLGIFVLICWLLSLPPWYRAAVWTASYLTFHSRKPVNPVLIGRAIEGLRCFIQWVLVPILLLPIVTHGFRRPSWQQSLKPRFWLEYIAVAVVCFYVPNRLIHWVPALDATAAQVASFIARFGLAYCAAVAGWLALVFFSSGGKPAVNQPSTAVLP